MTFSKIPKVKGWKQTSSDLLFNVLLHNMAEFPQDFTMERVILENVGIICSDTSNNEPSKYLANYGTRRVKVLKRAGVIIIVNAEVMCLLEAWRRTTRPAAVGSCFTSFKAMSITMTQSTIG